MRGETGGEFHRNGRADQVHEAVAGAVRERLAEHHVGAVVVEGAYEKESGAAQQQRRRDNGCESVPPRDLLTI